MIWVFEYGYDIGYWIFGLGYDLYPSKQIRSRIRSENIRTDFTPSFIYHSILKSALIQAMEFVSTKTWRRLIHSTAVLAAGCPDGRPRLYFVYRLTLHGVCAPPNPTRRLRPARPLVPPPASAIVGSYCNIYNTRSTFEISICNTCNILLKIDETLETCVWNTCKKNTWNAWKPLQTHATSR
jgi:hypothetical protein